MKKQNALYGAKYIRQLLKDQGLPCTYVTLLNYERRGIIPAPSSVMEYPDRNWRLYTASEVHAVVNAIKKFKKRK